MFALFDYGKQAGPRVFPTEIKGSFTMNVPGMDKLLGAGKYITDGTKTLDADGLRRIWELLAVVHHNAATYQGSAFARALVEIEEAVTQIRALLPDFEKV